LAIAALAILRLNDSLRRLPTITATLRVLKGLAFPFLEDGQW
jgi:hypothetical protein